MTDRERRLVWMAIAAGAAVVLALVGVFVVRPIVFHRQVTAALRDDDARRREWALAQDVEHFADAATFEGLLACVADPDVGVREAAGKLLYRIASTRLPMPAENEAVRDAVIAAAAGWEPSADEDVWHVQILSVYLPPAMDLAAGITAACEARPDDPAARVRLAELAGEMLDARPELRDVLKYLVVADPSNEVRIAALRALAGDESRSARERVADLTKMLPSLPSDASVRRALRDLVKDLGRDLVGEEAESWKDWLKKAVGGGD